MRGLFFRAVLILAITQSLFASDANTGDDSLVVKPTYAVEEGPVHQWIALQAYQKLPAGALKTEIAAYLPTNSTAIYYNWDWTAPSQWTYSGTEPYSNSTALIEGTWEEDAESLATPRYHFWDCDGDYNAGLFFDGPCDSALKRAQEVWWQQAISAYGTGDKALAYYRLGRLAHLLMDMSVPAHTMLDVHYWPYDDQYENYTAANANYKAITSYSANTAIPNIDGLPNYPGYTPPAYNSRLTKLFYHLAEKADDFDCDDAYPFDDDDKIGESVTYGQGKYSFARNALDPSRVFMRAESWTILGKLRTLTQYSDYDIFEGCSGVSEYSIYYYRSFYDSVNNTGAYVKVFYTDGSSENFLNFDEFGDVPDSVLKCIYQPELQARAIGYVAALYQLFWNTVNPLTLPLKAVSPSPSSGELNCSVNTDISWSDGGGAATYDVYFGSVNPPPFRGSQGTTIYDPGTLAANVTYFWRIDARNAAGVTTGDLWHFKTQPAWPEISGYVRDSSGNAITGVTVSADNGGASAVTDLSGYYIVTVPYSWQGTVWPSKTGYMFSPSAVSYSGVIGNFTNQNYVGTPPVTISGYVRTLTGGVGAGICNFVDDDGNFLGGPGENGYYSLSVPYGWSGTIAPVKTYDFLIGGWSVTPGEYEYSNTTVNCEHQDYTVIYGTVESPVFSNGGGILKEPMNVSVLCATPDAVVTYTTDGTEPTESSTPYSGPIAVSSEMTLKARGFRTDWNPSATAIAVYSAGVFPDLDNNACIDLADFSKMAFDWLTGCSPASHCDFLDLDRSGAIDFFETAMITRFWLEQSPLTRININFDHLPDGSPALSGNFISEDYARWGIHFGTADLMDSPTYLVSSAPTLVAGATCTGYPPGFYISMFSDFPVYEIFTDVTTAANERVRMLIKDKYGSLVGTVNSEPIIAAYDLSKKIYWKSETPIYSIEWWPPFQAATVCIDNLSVSLGAATLYRDEFYGPPRWTRTDTSVYPSAGIMRITADGLSDSDGIERVFDINLADDREVIIEQRVKLESGGKNYRLPFQTIYFEDASQISVTYLPSGPGQSCGWHFDGWTGVNDPCVPGSGEWDTATADYWTVTRLVLRPSGGELYMKPDDAEKEWYADNFHLITSADWSHSKITKIGFRQPWDSVNCIDYVDIKCKLTLSEQ